jgi:hypothetical protein
MRRENKTSKIRFVFRDDPGLHGLDINIEPMTPLESYKREYEKQLGSDLYGKRLIFKYLGSLIRYGNDAINSPNK